MFDLWCPVAGCTVLRWTGDIVSIDTVQRGAIDMLVRCDCDQLVLVRTGHARRGAEDVVHGVDPDALGAQARRGTGALR